MSVVTSRGVLVQTVVRPYLGIGRDPSSRSPRKHFCPGEFRTSHWQNESSPTETEIEHNPSRAHAHTAEQHSFSPMHFLLPYSYSRLQVLTIPRRFFKQPFSKASLSSWESEQWETEVLKGLNSF